MGHRSKALVAAVPGALLLIMLTGCSAAAASVKAELPRPTATASVTTLTSAKFGAFVPGAVATTYNESAVPVGASVSISLTSTAEGTFATVRGAGLPPSREITVSLHTKACGPRGSAAGPRYLAVPDNSDMRGGSLELVMTPNPDGSVEGRTAVGWNLRSGEAASLVLSEEKLGAVGCVTLA